MSKHNRIKGEVIGCGRIAGGYNVSNSGLIKSSF